VKVTRDIFSLYLGINNADGTTDNLLAELVQWGSYKVEQWVADDPATVWDVAALNALANAPTENADYIAAQPTTMSSIAWVEMTR